MKKRNKISICLFIGMGFIVLFNNGCNKDDNPNPTGSNGYTTLERTIIPNTISPFPPPIYAYEISKYDLYGYGGWQYGPGVPCQKRLDIMSAGYSEFSTIKAVILKEENDNELKI